MLEQQYITPGINSISSEEFKEKHKNIAGYIESKWEQKRLYANRLRNNEKR